MSQARLDTRIRLTMEEWISLKFSVTTLFFPSISFMRPSSSWSSVAGCDIVNRAWETLEALVVKIL